MPKEPSIESKLLYDIPVAKLIFCSMNKSILRGIRMSTTKHDSSYTLISKELLIELGENTMLPSILDVHE